MRSRSGCELECCAQAAPLNRIYNAHLVSSLDSSSSLRNDDNDARRTWPMASPTHTKQTLGERTTGGPPVGEASARSHGKQTYTQVPHGPARRERLPKRGLPPRILAAPVSDDTSFAATGSARPTLRRRPLCDSERRAGWGEIPAGPSRCCTHRTRQRPPPAQLPVTKESTPQGHIP